MLLLSYVALRQGDGAGVMTAGPQRSWLPPRKGVGTINAILNHVYDINPQPVEVDYLTAATELAVRQRRTGRPGELDLAAIQGYMRSRLEGQLTLDELAGVSETAGMQ